MTVNTSDNRYGTAQLIVAPTIAEGANYTTIQAAITAAAANSTIFVRPGTYTENLSITKNVNIVAYGQAYKVDANISPIIKGKLTVSAGIVLKVFGCDLQTNAGNIVDCSAIGAIAILSDCRCTIETAITAFVIGDSTSSITLNNCYGSGTGTAKLFAATAGNFRAAYCFFEDLGADSTIDTNRCTFQYCTVIGAGVTTSGSGFVVAEYVNFGASTNNPATNTTYITNNGGSSRIEHCRFNSGTASCIVITSNQVSCRHTTLSSSNIAVVSGAGTFIYANLSFEGTSSAITATTQTINIEGPSKSIGSANIGGSNTLTTTNTDNTSTSSNAALNVTVGGTSGGDPYTNYAIGSTISYCLGIDNTDSDSLKLNTIAAALATPSTGTNLWKMTSAGEVTMPLQPAFLATLGTADLNVTGNGATYTLGSGNALTEIFDQNSDFVTTGTFTAPVTGRYSLASNFVMGDITAAMTFQGMNITTSNRTYQFGFQNDGTVQTVAVVPGIISTHGSVLADMDAGDTFTTSIAISGGVGNTADSSPSSARIFMSGFLAC